MCEPITLLIAASTAISSVGGFVSAAGQSAMAQSEADWRNYQLEVQNRQLAEDQELTRIQALETENKRLDQNEAFLAGSGVGESRSFLQGVEPQGERALRQDVASLRLQSATQINRIADQIAVNKAEGQFARARADLTSSYAYTNAAFNAASSITRGAYLYKTR
jgi:hypothetical protein